MKNELVFCALFCFLNQSCNQTEPSPQICLVNDSGHDVHFWMLDNRGYSQNYFDSYCTDLVPAGSNLLWNARFPTSDPSLSATGYSYFAIWEGAIEMGMEDKDFHFTDTSGHLVYDFRDSLIGNYTFTETMLEVQGTDTINNVSTTLTGQISKATAFNLVLLQLDTNPTDTLVFDRYTHSFNWNGDLGHLFDKTFDWGKTDYLQNDHFVKQIIKGIKN